MLWVVGGNTFTLRRAMRESGLDQLLPEMLKDSRIVYGGFSAGACVLAPSLRGIHLADEPEKVPQGYSKEILWDGLGIVDFYIVPHFRSEHPESPAMERVIAYYQEHEMRHFALADGEAIVVNGSSLEIIAKAGY